MTPVQFLPLLSALLVCGQTYSGAPLLSGFDRTLHAGRTTMHDDARPGHRKPFSERRVFQVLSRSGPDTPPAEPNADTGVTSGTDLSPAVTIAPLSDALLADTDFSVVEEMLIALELTETIDATDSTSAVFTRTERARRDPFSSSEIFPLSISRPASVAPSSTSLDMPQTLPGNEGGAPAIPLAVPLPNSAAQLFGALAFGVFVATRRRRESKTVQSRHLDGSRAC